jgi:hypothetical protein
MLSSAFITALSLYFAGILLTAGGITGVDELHIHDIVSDFVDHSPATADRQIDKQAGSIFQRPGFRSMVNLLRKMSSRQNDSGSRSRSISRLISANNLISTMYSKASHDHRIGDFLLMLSMFLTGLSFRGFRQYLRWNFSQLRLTPAT